MTGLKTARRVVVKPSCVSDKAKHAATHFEALDALFDFITPLCQSQIVLAEGVGMGDTMTAFKDFGYLQLQEKYDFTIVDLNDDVFETIDLVESNGKTWQARFSKTISTSDYLISISPMKTHDSVVYTGAIKNVAVGSLIRPTSGLSGLVSRHLGLSRNDKQMIHQGAWAMNENIKRLAQAFPPHLAVIDGYESMEGNGPISGDLHPSHYAIASSDPLAADWLATQLMGIDLSDVGYLSMLEEAEEEKTDYFVVGDDWKKNIRKFKMHSNFDRIRHWQKSKGKP